MTGPSQDDWQLETARLRTENGELASDNARLSAELKQKEKMVTDLSSRMDTLAEQMRGRQNGGHTNVDLVERVNRLTSELQLEREKNRRLKEQRA
jgi:hypothetical protein